LGSIEIEATRIVSLPDSHRNDGHSLQALGIKPQFLLTSSGIEIFADRERGHCPEAKSSGSGAALTGIPRGIETVRSHGHDEEHGHR
jgi:hypothetical protein